MSLLAKFADLICNLPREESEAEAKARLSFQRMRQEIIQLVEQEPDLFNAGSIRDAEDNLFSVEIVGGKMNIKPCGPFREYLWAKQIRGEMEDVPRDLDRFLKLITDSANKLREK